MLRRHHLLSPIARAVTALPDRIAHGMLVKELDTWVRLEFLGVMARSRVADALAEPRTIDELLDDRTGIVDRELLLALLDLGVSLRELRVRRGRYSIRGRRTRAIVGSSPDLRGLVEELVVYGNAVYAALDSHLRGEPPHPYDADVGDVIAAASRVAEPILGPTIGEITRRVQPSRVLDIGCGSGAYLRHALEAAPAATGVGVDLNNAALRAASELLSDLQAEGRCELKLGDIEDLVADFGQFELVTLLNNIYYWRPGHRASALRTIGKSVAPGGTIVVASAAPDGQSFNRHLDLMLRVTESSHRLPTRDELAADLHAAGYIDTAVLEPVPMSGLLVATAQKP